MPSYVKFLKEILAKKRGMNDFEIVALMQATRDVFNNGVLEKMTDLGSFTVDKFLFPADFVILNYKADQEDEVFAELFSPKEFFKEEDANYILEEVHAMSNARKFEHLDLLTKGDKKTKPSIEEPPELELKLLSNHLKYTYFGENDTLFVIISIQLNVAEEKALLNM
ncbi:uncharacterized protein E5676_scaffold637G00280 [Cucumis melo var. makuwa]|uniref:Uncharacterized protein n=1 Tax=Cucumis melo var. makuwa TaxID=1194695 RepID=A0A5D3CWE9_CUCMM|nr:uncharacterized protein E5676_scaffold637G00280 [Cucumis melo var. makuwa]